VAKAVTKVQMKFARYLIIGVSGLGLISTTLLLSDPPSNAEINPSLFNVNFQSHANGRLMASDDTTVFTPDTMFEINCKDNDQKLETSSTRFRLKGQTCTDEAAALSTQIQNRSNGYIATVFHRDPQSFTTDYINLNEGQNEIAVRFDTNNGPIDKTITITRSPSSIKMSN
jgi:hypothetical protein